MRNNRPQKNMDQNLDQAKDFKSAINGTRRNCGWIPFFR